MLTNMALQGRFDSFPVRRGVTRVKALQQAGVNVSFGQDNLVDAFYPLGTAGMLPVLNMALHACQLLGYDEIEQSMDFITTNAAKTLGLTSLDYGLIPGAPANMVVMQAPSVFETIRTQLPLRFSIRGGKLLAAMPALSAEFYDPRSNQVHSLSLGRK